MQFRDDLFTLRGRVIGARPNASPDFVMNSLNDRLRQILDHRTFWADLLKFGILSFPAPYSLGTVNMTTGDATVTGYSTDWPVADVVNTILPEGVAEFGYVQVAPASMAGITYNSMLLVDAGQAAQEIVPVVQINRDSFVAIFAKQHDPNCTVTQSSLANRQLRLTQANPVFTVAAITSPTTLELTLPWGGQPLPVQTYVLKTMYVTLAPNLKAVIGMKDEQTGFPVRIHVSVDEADNRDPRRTLVSGNPYYSLVDLGANEQGNMLYEVWPAPSTARQFSYAYWMQWPDLEKDTDRTPPFINPSILVYGAIADAKMLRTGPKDPYYDPAGAQYYEGRFNQALQEAKNADEAKRLEAMKNPWWRNMSPGNVDTQQLNDPQFNAFWGGSDMY